MTDSETRRLHDQLRRAFDGAAWHGPAVQEVLAGVTGGQAGARPVADAHSIWELVLHITAWEKAALRMLEGEAVDLPTAEDWPAPAAPTDDAWQRTLASLAAVHAALLDAVSRLPDARLGDIAPGREYSIYFLLHGVVQHALYHAGQIAVLRKL